MPWHDFGGASWAISTWTVLGRLPVALALAAMVWCAVRRGWSWRAAVLVTSAFVAGLTAGTALDQPHLMPGFGMEANVSGSHVLGLDAIFGDDGAAVAGHFMMVVSP